jgi:folate-binding protein YgfZ
MSTALYKNSDQSSSRPVGSGNPRAEFQALLSGCGLYDLSDRARIAVTGGDRVRWLNGMVTNNVRDLAPNHGLYGFLLNAQGRIQGDLYAYNLGDSLMVDTEGGQRERILAHFDKYIIADDVEIADVSATLASIGVAGPRARAVLEAAGILGPDLAQLELCTPKCDCACGCLQCTLVRGEDFAGPSLVGTSLAGPSYEIWLAPDKLKSIWDALIAAGATPAGAEALELRRIGFGIPRFGIDISERDLPQETGQTRALNFTKGCYLGQEIVERIRSRGAVHRMFTALAVEGALPEAATPILADEKEAGEITSSAILPLAGGDRAVALGYLRREAHGKDLRAGTATLKVTTVPMVW